MAVASLLLSVLALVAGLAAWRESRRQRPPASGESRWSDMERRLELVEKHLELSSPQISASLAQLSTRLQRLESVTSEVREPIQAAPVPPKLPPPIVLVLPWSSRGNGTLSIKVISHDLPPIASLS